MDHLDGVQLARYLGMGLYWNYFEFGVLQRGAKKGERGFCPKQNDMDPKNPDEVAWPNATEVTNDVVESKYFESSGVGLLPQVMRNWFSGLYQYFAQGKCD